MQFCECTLKVILSSSQCMNIFSQFFDAFQDMVECSCLRKLQDDQSHRNCNDHADQTGSTPANEHEYQCGQCIYADAVNSPSSAGQRLVTESRHRGHQSCCQREITAQHQIQCPWNHHCSGSQHRQEIQNRNDQRKEYCILNSHDQESNK